MTIPCKDCLKLPACRHKRYTVVLNSCDDLRRTLYLRGTFSVPNRTKEFNSLIKSVVKIMNPIKWHIKHQTYDVEVYEILQEELGHDTL